jgi:proteic killer suppression protein
LYKICTNASAARKEYGENMARKIHQRIDFISAADCVDTLVQGHIGRCHLLSGDRKGQYAMDLVQPYRLLFILIGNDIEIAEVQEIVDYH